MASLPRLYNTLTRTTEELSPKGERVGVYCCGPTVYDVPHAGHARAALAPDLLVRRLRNKGFEVNYVRNITDVDDKILMRAEKYGEPPLELSRRMATIYQEQMREVGCLAPDHEPRVSEHLTDIYQLIATLLENGSAYAIDAGAGRKDIYFSVRSFAEYGKLSRRRIDDLIAGARVEKDEAKHDPLDFALWKSAPAEEWGWESPWGRGRPGWHIECSAMCSHFLGHGFDVHAGGMDLIFPHHENEVAQSEAAHPGQGPLAKLWMHNGFVNVDKEKMSKSLGNFVTVRDVLERNDPEGFRWFLLGAQYRGPLQFDTEQLSTGRVVPTLRNLARIAMVFSKDLSYFFETEPQPTFRVHRRRERVRLPQTGVESPTYFFESLGYMVPDRHMDPYFAEFVPLDQNPEPKAHLHPGFEFLYVLDGELAIRHGEHESTLEAGDAVYFDASTPHSYVCAGKRPAGAIIVTMHQAAPVPMGATVRPAGPQAGPRPVPAGAMSGPGMAFPEKR